MQVRHEVLWPVCHALYTRTYEQLIFLPTPIQGWPTSSSLSPVSWTNYSLDSKRITRTQRRVPATSEVLNLDEGVGGGSEANLLKVAERRLIVQLWLVKPSSPDHPDLINLLFGQSWSNACWNPWHPEGHTSVLKIEVAAQHNGLHFTIPNTQLQPSSQMPLLYASQPPPTYSNFFLKCVVSLERN